MNYVSGSLEMYKARVAEKRKQDLLEAIVAKTFSEISKAISQNKGYVEMNTADFEKISDYFSEDGYSVAVRKDGWTVLSGWANG